MNITVITRSKQKRDLINNLACFYAEQLNLSNSKFNLTIELSSKINRYKFNGGVSLSAPKTLKMYISTKLSTEKIILTVAHEMIHVKQYAKGQLKSNQSRSGDKTVFTWLGKKYTNPYYQLPWELEAFSRERILANTFIFYNKFNIL